MRFVRLTAIVTALLFAVSANPVSAQESDASDTTAANKTTADKKSKQDAAEEPSDDEQDKAEAKRGEADDKKTADDPERPPVQNSSPTTIDKLAEPTGQEGMLGRLGELENRLFFLQKKVKVAELEKKLSELKGGPDDTRTSDGVQIKWVLQSVEIGPGDHRVAEIGQRGSDRTMPVESGESLPGGWHVKRITDRFVEVAQGNQNRRLWLSGDVTNPAKPEGQANDSAADR